MNPVSDVLEKRPAALDGGTWTLFAQTLKKLGIEVRFFDPGHPEALPGLIDANTRLACRESIGTPQNNVPDFHRLADIAHWHGLPVVVDNTVLTPALFRPLDHGIDIAVYSATKFLGGHGVHIGGAIVGRGRFDGAASPGRWPEFTAPDDAYHGVVFTEALKPLGNLACIVHIRTHWLRDTSGSMSPFAAFLFLLGIETLHLRLERQVQNAQALVEWLDKRPVVEWVKMAMHLTHVAPTDCGWDRLHFRASRTIARQGAGSVATACWTNR